MLHRQSHTCPVRSSPLSIRARLRPVFALARVYTQARRHRSCSTSPNLKQSVHTCPLLGDAAVVSDSCAEDGGTTDETCGARTLSFRSNETAQVRPTNGHRVLKKRNRRTLTKPRDPSCFFFFFFQQPFCGSKLPYFCDSKQLPILSTFPYFRGEKN